MSIPGGCADDGKRAADAVNDVAETDVVTYVAVSMSIFFLLVDVEDRACESCPPAAGQGSECVNIRKNSNTRTTG